jgi:hypothetical protein
MKRFALCGALALFAALSTGQASAQMEGIGSGGLGDARAQNQPTSVGINNGYRGPGYGYGYAPPGYAAGPTAYRGRSAYIVRHRHHHRHYRHW